MRLLLEERVNYQLWASAVQNASQVLIYSQATVQAVKLFMWNAQQKAVRLVVLHQPQANVKSGPERQSTESRREENDAEVGNLNKKPNVS